MRSQPLPEAVVVGRVRRPHGVGGEVTVEVLSHVAGRFDVGRTLDVVGPGGQRRRLQVASARDHRGVLLVRFDGVETRDGAEALRGAGLEVSRGETPAAPEGSYYYHELVGCVCHDRTLGGLGSVVEVVEDGGGLLLDLQAGGARRLIPFVREYLSRVDVAEGRIEVDLPAGLVEICESKS